MFSSVFPRVILLVLSVVPGFADLPPGYNYLGKSRTQGAGYKQIRDSYGNPGHGGYDDFTGAGYREIDIGPYKGNAYSSESKFAGNQGLTSYLNNNLQALYGGILSAEPSDYHNNGYNGNLGPFTNGHENYPTEENYHSIRGLSQIGYLSSENLKGLNSGTREVGYKFGNHGAGSFFSGTSSNNGDSEIGSSYNGGENYGISDSHEGSGYSAGDNYYRNRGNYRGYVSSIKGYNDHSGASYRRGRYARKPGSYYGGSPKGYRIKNYHRGLGYSGALKGYNEYPKGSSLRGQRGNSYIINSHNGFNYGNEGYTDDSVHVRQTYSANGYGGIKGGYSHLIGDFGEDGGEYSHSNRGYEDMHVGSPYRSYGEHHYSPRGYVKRIKGKYTSGINGDYKFEDTSGGLYISQLKSRLGYRDKHTAATYKSCPPKFMLGQKESKYISGGCIGGSVVAVELVVEWPGIQ